MWPALIDRLPERLPSVRDGDRSRDGTIRLCLCHQSPLKRSPSFQERSEPSFSGVASKQRAPQRSAEHYSHQGTEATHKAAAPSSLRDSCLLSGSQRLCCGVPAMADPRRRAARRITHEEESCRCYTLGSGRQNESTT